MFINIQQLYAASDPPSSATYRLQLLIFSPVSVPIILGSRFCAAVYASAAKTEPSTDQRNDCRSYIRGRQNFQTTKNTSKEAILPNPSRKTACVTVLSGPGNHSICCLENIRVSETERVSLD